VTSTEIELHQNGHLAERDIVDGWLAVASDVIKLANIIAPTEFVPAVYRDNPPAVAAAILTGRELGIGPLTSLRHVQVVKGTPTLSAEYKRARVLAAGHEFDVLELNTQRCKVSGRRRGSNKPPLEVTFTMDDAKMAGLLAPSKSGKPGAWQTRPRRMLFARAGSELCDFLFADVVNGLPTAEIVADSTEDDDFAGYDEPPAKPAARTARRARTTPQKLGDQAGNSPVASSLAPADGPPLPPLPGEDEAQGERDYDSPGTVTTGKGGQLTAIWTILTKVFEFSDDEKPLARTVCGHIIGRDIESTTSMSRNEAVTVLDTLANWQAIAHEQSEEPRAVLVAMMAVAAQDGAEGNQDGGSDA
jgi:hypothetical protein